MAQVEEHLPSIHEASGGFPAMHKLKRWRTEGQEFKVTLVYTVTIERYFSSRRVAFNNVTSLGWSWGVGQRGGDGLI